jgi:hypothetical protein
LSILETAANHGRRAQGTLFRGGGIAYATYAVRGAVPNQGAALPASNIVFHDMDVLS